MKSDRLLILASSSPRRRDILEDAGFTFEISPPKCTEIFEGLPENIVVENARRKARSIRNDGDTLIIGCDTLGICNGHLLGKPEDIEDARRMLMLQQEHPCKVISGLALRDVMRGTLYHGYEVSIVEMDGGTDGVEEYLSSGQWKGKAGSFGIQDRGPIGAKVVSGNEDNVMGLPMDLLRRLLSLVGFEYPRKTPSEGKYD